jgi:UDP-hydrolysing UDP-N-acetyl-D-glucosamine 2-epimerase
MSKRKICIVTGTRAEYGLLFWLMKEIQADPELELQLIATGMHLAPEFGLTYKVIEDDGFVIDAKVEMLLASDTTVGITKSIGLGVIGFADALDSLKPDLLVLLGDRFEILAAAQAALVARIPIAHLFGGDTTEGAFDEAIRHSITKMAHLHFVSNVQSAARVRQLGENPEHVFTFGSTGIDQIKRVERLSRGEVEKQIGYTFQKKNLLVTFHPATLDEHSPGDQFQELLDALALLGSDVGVIFTYPNADPAGRSLIPMIDSFVAEHSQSRAYASLGQLRYLSVMAQVDAVVGNSSSGLYEAPSFKTPTVNIGDRQKGRLQADSVVNCATDAKLIGEAINAAFTMDCSEVINPFGDGDTSQKIKSVLKSVQLDEMLLKKHFFDLR